ncbi:MAG: DUF4268 domain-containing protein [Ferruginibacter sp.]
MYSKEQASAIRQEFWTALGKYLSPIPGAHAEKINWINYKTGVKGIHFKMDADNKNASVRIDISSQHVEQRNRFYDIFLTLKTELEQGNNWEWQRQSYDAAGKEMACISRKLAAVNIFQKEHWPALISFFKDHALRFDEFWHSYKEVFEMNS